MKVTRVRSVELDLAQDRGPPLGVGVLRQLTFVGPAWVGTRADPAVRVVADLARVGRAEREAAVMGEAAGVAWRRAGAAADRIRLRIDAIL